MNRCDSCRWIIEVIGGNNLEYICEKRDCIIHYPKLAGLYCQYWERRDNGKEDNKTP